MRKLRRLLPWSVYHKIPFVLGKVWNLNPVNLYDAHMGPKPYIENREFGSVNLAVKKERAAAGWPLEWPNIVALNEAVAGLIGDATTVANIGAGTGIFERIAAEKHPSVQFVASEFDEECVEWCKQHQSRKNITYTALPMQELLRENGKFDLAVTIEVIEHVREYGAFLEEFSQLADRAIITTPNKAGSLRALVANPPRFNQHVREWTAGEFYWVLRVFYREVTLYAMPNIYVPQVREIGLLSTMAPLIAVCER
jgi:hypothetical protein